jgi:23S rRNA (uracil1939-C5)-methyltransferase
MFSSNERPAPVAAGQEYDVKIEDTSRQGDGIARIKGFVIFVPQTKVGDEVKIKVETVRQKFAIASVVS